VGRQKSIAALEEAMAHDKAILLCAQKKAKTNEPAAEDIFAVGTIGQIIQLLRLPDGTVKVLVEGKQRARIRRFLDSERFLLVEADDIEEQSDRTVELEALMRSVHSTFEAYVKLNKRIPPEMLTSVASIDDPARLADTIVAHLSLKLQDKQSILETESPAKRLEKLYELMQGEIEILQVEKKIRTRVKKQMEKTQKEYYLNEQMQAIQKELGERDEFKNEIQELEEKIKNKKMSKEATLKAKKELKKLKMMSPMSAEATVVRNYIDWILSLPWYEYTEDKLEIPDAETILDEDHYGLKKPKQRIVEYLAVQKLKAAQAAEGQAVTIKGPILCFVGPPGVGKTSLGQSIARAMNRRFIRISLGGVRDEAEIRGHRRTYIGAMPGRLAQAMKQAGASNPVFMLDEIDKISVGIQGDPAAALLEVLDPAQNHAFRDHYLEIPLDLSRVLFIATANQLGTVHPALLDRMEIIPLTGYSEEEKRHIARRYLLPRQIAENGLNPSQLEIDDAALTRVITEWTREAGVRTLERQLGTIARKVAARAAAGPTPSETIERVHAAEVAKFLGPPPFRPDVAFRTSRPGVATGVAWTEAGGDVLFIEAVLLPGGHGNVTLTGQLGNVMQESARAALSHIRQQAPALAIDPDFLNGHDLHLHVPAGAIPKDGPSAGVTMATAMVSAIRSEPVREDVAMTGEITLSGLVLPVGGIREKALAARRHGIKIFILPQQNLQDTEELPEEVKKDMRFVPVSTLDEVLPIALPAPASA
jgi:ATP-dependent Lon protease